MPILTWWENFTSRLYKTKLILFIFLLMSKEHPLNRKLHINYYTREELTNLQQYCMFTCFVTWTRSLSNWGVAPAKKPSPWTAQSTFKYVTVIDVNFPRFCSTHSVDPIYKKNLELDEKCENAVMSTRYYNSIILQENFDLGPQTNLKHLNKKHAGRYVVRYKAQVLSVVD